MIIQSMMRAMLLLTINMYIYKNKKNKKKKEKSCTDIHAFSQKVFHSIF